VVGVRDVEAPCEFSGYFLGQAGVVIEYLIESFVGDGSSERRGLVRGASVA